MKDDNYVDKEYDEANEQNVATKRWGCTFCWSGRTISRDGLGMPCYSAYGKTIGS